MAQPAGGGAEEGLCHMVVVEAFEEAEVAVRFAGPVVEVGHRSDRAVGLAVTAGEEAAGPGAPQERVVGGVEEATPFDLQR